MLLGLPTMASSAPAPDHTPPSAAYPPPHVWETMSADERRTWLQTIQTAVTASMERGTKRQRSDTTAADEDESGKTVPPAVLPLLPRFAGIPRSALVAIHDHTFEVRKHLIKLRLPQFTSPASQEEAFTYSTGSDGLRLKKVTSFKEWGHDSSLWSHCFATYAAAWTSIFGQSFPTAGIGMWLFHRRICDLARSYKWQDTVLLLALDKHQLLLDKGVSTASVEDWNIDASLEGQYLRLDTLLPSKASPAASPLPTRGQRAAAQPNKGHAICQTYNNTTGCDWRNCRRRHVCSKCEGDHALPNCKKK